MNSYKRPKWLVKQSKFEFFAILSLPKKITFYTHWVRTLLKICNIGSNPCCVSPSLKVLTLLTYNCIWTSDSLEVEVKKTSFSHKFGRRGRWTPVKPNNQAFPEFAIIFNTLISTLYCGGEGENSEIFNEDFIYLLLILSFFIWNA